MDKKDFKLLISDDDWCLLGDWLSYVLVNPFVIAPPVIKNILEDLTKQILSQIILPQRITPPSEKYQEN